MSGQDELREALEDAISVGLDRDYFPAAPAIAKSAMRAAWPLVAAALAAERAELCAELALAIASLDEDLYGSRGDQFVSGYDQGQVDAIRVIRRAARSVSVDRQEQP